MLKGDDELLNAIKEKYPNPNRVGCPEQATLRRMAEDIHAHTDLFYHIITCGACVRDYETYKADYRRRRVLRGVSLAAAALILVIAGGYLLWRGPFRLPQERVPSEVSKSGAQKKPGTPDSSKGDEGKLLAAQVIDFRDRVVFRGEQSPQTQPPVQLLRGKRELRILLPMGSEPGQYEVQLLSTPNEPVLTLVGTAKKTGKDTVLPILLDSTKLPKGEYRLGIRPLGWNWTHYPVRLE